MKKIELRPLSIAAILLLCAILFSCSDITVQNHTIVEQKLKVDTVAHKMDAAQGLDSALYYFQKQVDYKLKRDEAEVMYLRTGKDRYRVEGNRYVDSSHFYSKKLQSLAVRK